MNGLAAAAEDAGVARLDAQSRGIYSDVGPRFVNDGDNAQRNSHLAKVQAVGPVPFFETAADRVGKLDDLAYTDSHIVNPLFCQLQTIQHGFAHAVVPCRGNIEPIRFDNPGRLPFQLVG